MRNLSYQQDDRFYSKQWLVDAFSCTQVHEKFISHLAPLRAIARPDAPYPMRHIKSSEAQNHSNVIYLYMGFGRRQKWSIIPKVWSISYGWYLIPFQSITVVSLLWEMVSHWWLLCQSERPREILDELIQPWIHNPFENHRIFTLTNRLFKIAIENLYLSTSHYFGMTQRHQFNGTHVFILKWMIMNFI